MGELHVLKYGGDPTKPVDSLVAMLEKALEKAKSGELRGAIIVCETLESIYHDHEWGPGASPSALAGEVGLAGFTIHMATGRLKAL